MVEGFWFDWFPSKVIFALKQASGMEDLVDRGKVLSAIEDLDMSSFSLAVVPPFVKDMENLKYLNLSENAIKGFVDAASLSASVESVNLSKNPITLFSFEGLQESAKSTLSIVNLDENRLSVIPKGISEVKSLRVLRLIDNQIDCFGEEFKLHDDLRELYLSGNSISEISDEEARELSKCKEVYLAHNNLKSIPLSLLGGNLEVLDVQGNEIEDWEFLTEAARLGIDVQV